MVLGIAFLTGTLVFTDTIKRTFDDLFADIYDDTDTFVRSSTSISMEFGGDVRGRIPESILTTIAEVDGVADAQGIVQGFAQVVDTEGNAIGNPGQGAPTFGMSYVSGALSPWQLTTGSRAPAPGELVLDKGAADKGDFAIGDTVTVLTQTGPHSFPLVGIARFGSADSPGGATVAIFDLATAQQVLLGQPGELDAVMVDAAAGVDEVDLTARVERALPDGVEALTGTEIVAETQNAMQEGLSFFNTFLLVFAAIGLVVACFTIYNTFQIVVTQRGREMALMRAVGASRRQVLAAQLVEAFVVGVCASVVGLVAGVFVAGLLKAMLQRFGIDIPAGGTVVLASDSGRRSHRRDGRHGRVGRVPFVARLADPADRSIPRRGRRRHRPARPAPRLRRRTHDPRCGRLGGRAGRVGHRMGRSRRADDLHRCVRARTGHRPSSGEGCRSSAAGAVWHHR